jgi:hypothetical protein
VNRAHVVAQVREGHAARVDGAILCLGDEFFHKRAHGFRLGNGGGDAAVVNEAHGEVGQQRVPVILTAAGGQVSLDVGDGPQVIGQGGISELELTGNDEEVRIARVAISDTAGAELYAETFVDQPLVPLGGLFGALLGASAGLAATVVVRRGRNRIEGALAVAALALPAALALWMPSRH